MGASDEGRRCGKLEQLIEAILKWLKQACPEEQGAKRCMQAADALVTKLSGGVPGLTISRICAEECRFAADADCYSCKVTAHALAYVYALANEEETEFTDFILKGEVQ